MKDKFGSELKVGDKVVVDFTYRVYRFNRLSYERDLTTAVIKELRPLYRLGSSIPFDQCAVVEINGMLYSSCGPEMALKESANA